MGSSIQVEYFVACLSYVRNKVTLSESLLKFEQGQLQDAVVGAAVFLKGTGDPNTDSIFETPALRHI